MSSSATQKSTHTLIFIDCHGACLFVLSYLNEKQTKATESMTAVGAIYYKQLLSAVLAIVNGDGRRCSIVLFQSITYKMAMRYFKKVKVVY